MLKMNFFVPFLCISILIISLGIGWTGADATNECSNNKTIYMINSEYGMRFYVTNNTGGTVNVTYDCSLDNSDWGTIQLDDKEHPKHINSLFIKNCLNVTVNVETCHSVIKSLQIIDVKDVIIYSTQYKPLEIKIADVKMLKWFKGQDYNHNHNYNYNYNNCPQNPHWQTKASLILKNVVVKNFEERIFKSINMTGVTFESMPQNELSCSLLSIKDSRFGYSTKSFIGDVAQVYIVNTTFEGLLPKPYYIHVNESFVFSNNHVKNLFNTFNVISPKVEIVGNTIDYAKYSSFKIQISHPNYSDNIFKSLNVSFNKINTLQNNFVELADESNPDFLVIENNYFNCSCMTPLYLEELAHSHSRNILSKFLFDDYSNNVCANFENCPLRKLLGQEVNVCRNSFVCPHDFSDVSNISLNEISSELKNLTEALHLLIEQNQKYEHLSDKASTENTTTNSSF